MPDKAGSDLDVQTCLRGIAKTASLNKQHRFRDLYRLLNTEMLQLAWQGLKKSAAIADEDITVKEYGADLEANLERLVERLRQKRYRAKLIKRRYILRENGKKRPLGIPALEDKIVQRAAAMILTAIYEQDFLDCSYGYRPGKGAKDAVSDLVFQLQFGVFGYIVEADIKSYFDNISHNELIRLGRYELQVEPSKTKIVRFSRFHPSRKRGRTFAFLGFEFYWFKDRKGISRAMRRTAPTKQRIALRRIKAWLKAFRHLPKRQFFQSLKRKLIGHYNYFYVRGNSHSVWSFYSEVIKYTKKWLNRRSQRKSYNWEKFKRVLEYTGIPKPRPTEKKRLHQVALG
jgi:hypothetical protein